MSVKKTSISLDERLYKESLERMGAYYCNSFSEYVAKLIERDLISAQALADGRVAEHPVPYTPKSASVIIHAAADSQVAHQHGGKGNISQKR